MSTSDSYNVHFYVEDACRIRHCCINMFFYLVELAWYRRRLLTQPGFLCFLSGTVCLSMLVRFKVYVVRCFPHVMCFTPEFRVLISVYRCCLCAFAAFMWCASHQKFRCLFFGASLLCVCIAAFMWCASHHIFVHLYICFAADLFLYAFCNGSGVDASVFVWALPPPVRSVLFFFYSIYVRQCQEYLHWFNWLLWVRWVWRGHLGDAELPRVLGVHRRWQWRSWLFLAFPPRRFHHGRRMFHLPSWIAGR